jgi:Zn-dependent protease with chaperone function
MVFGLADRQTKGAGAARLFGRLTSKGPLWLGCAAALILSGCIAPQSYPYPGPAPKNQPPVPRASSTAAPLAPMDAARNFLAVVERVEPMAEIYCRATRAVADCDFQILVDDRPGQPKNAFQTLDRAGRPIIVFTIALIADARNVDEIAFILGHEAAHHISGHIPKAQQSAVLGAVLAGVAAQAAGLGDLGIEQAQQLGAGVAARSYSKEYELEADALGAQIAFDAGYDPRRGALFFDRLPDPGDQFLGSHPANAQRQATVAQVMARLTGQ